LIAVEETGSTNDDAIGMARSGAAHGTLVWARRQTRGRGRRGRAWASPEGNLHVSIVLRPGTEARRAGEIAFVAGLAVADACLALAPEADIRCKWPNDVLAGGRKIGGLLIESSFRGTAVDWIVAGIGLNLAVHPDDAEFPATHLAFHAGRPVTAAQGLNALARAFAARYEAWRADGFGPIREAWLARAAGVGRPIRVRLEHGEIDGVFAGIEDDGALRLGLRDGAVRRITAGDVFFPGPASAG
jgi:BirA family biotin operon repressor/biotin-[acetyl-CoA-carboxylase] ligase